MTELQKRGVEFLNIPSTYYDTLPDRVGHIDEDLEPLKRLGHSGRSRQRRLFAPNIHEAGGRPADALFEIIQRKGAKSFGKGNFKALFEAFEREQEARGNL